MTYIINHLLMGLVFGVSMSFISWIVGMVINSIIIRFSFYQKLENLNFIKDQTLNHLLGLRRFSWLIKNSFFKFFNPKIAIKKPKTDLSLIRKEMTLAEISHLIAFCFVIIVSLYQAFALSIYFALAMLIPNILMNLYPSLLQQENKRRIDKILEAKKD